VNPLIDRLWVWWQQPKPPSRTRDLTALAVFAGIAAYTGLGWVLSRVKP
jgi:hypothetical protein